MMQLHYLAQLYANFADGFIGTGLKKDELVTEVSEIMKCSLKSEYVEIDNSCKVLPY